MKIKITTTQDGAAVSLAGALEIHHIEAARDALLNHVESSQSLKLDLSGVESCDAAGLQLLLAARVSARVAGKAFAICASAPAVEECGRLLGVAWLAQPN
jgi:anti-anti-sigma factor